MKLPLNMMIFWICGAAILLLTLGKLAWVVYFGETRDGVEVTFLGILLETIPIFLVVVCIGLLISWKHTIAKGKASELDSEEK